MLSKFKAVVNLSETLRDRFNLKNDTALVQVLGYDPSSIIFSDKELIHTSQIFWVKIILPPPELESYFQVEKKDVVWISTSVAKRYNLKNGYHVIGVDDHAAKDFLEFKDS